MISLFQDETVVNYDGTNQIDTGLTWTPGVWEKWEMDYVTGASSYILTVGGVSATVPDALSPNQVQGIYFWSGGGQPGTYQIDSVLVTGVLPFYFPGDANRDNKHNQASILPVDFVLIVSFLISPSAATETR